VADLDRLAVAPLERREAVAGRRARRVDDHRSEHRAPRADRALVEELVRAGEIHHRRADARRQPEHLVERRAARVALRPPRQPLGGRVQAEHPPVAVRLDDGHVDLRQPRSEPVRGCALRVRPPERAAQGRFRSAVHLCHHLSIVGVFPSETILNRSEPVVFLG